MKRCGGLRHSLPTLVTRTQPVNESQILLVGSVVHVISLLTHEIPGLDHPVGVRGVTM